jgi:transcriptional regulator GlxA family with amidase domain
MSQFLNIQEPQGECNRFAAFLQNVRDTIAALDARNRKLRAIASFQAFALALAFVGLLADWRITAAWYAIALCYLPFFARGRR